MMSAPLTPSLGNSPGLIFRAENDCFDSLLLPPSSKSKNASEKAPFCVNNPLAGFFPCLLAWDPWECGVVEWKSIVGSPFQSISCQYMETEIIA